MDKTLLKKEKTKDEETVKQRNKQKYTQKETPGIPLKIKDELRCCGKRSLCFSQNTSHV